MDKKPSQEQIKEFWKWCGFKHHTFPEHWKLGNIEIEGARWITPDGNAAIIDTPNIDLNNLFKYAIPLILKQLGKQFIPPFMKLCQLWYDKLVTLYGDSDKIEHANIALFWVIWEVIHG
jgi:putative transposon-encoded protein